MTELKVQHNILGLDWTVDNGHSSTQKFFHWKVKHKNESTLAH